MGIRKRLFTEKVVRYRDRLPREEVMASSLAELRSVWMMFLVTWFAFRLSCKEQRVGLSVSYVSL